jgi:predicted Zn-dependent peptidase
MRGISVKSCDKDIFTIHIFIAAGSVCENTKENGLSHMLEHMLFKIKKDGANGNYRR